MRRYSNSSGNNPGIYSQNVQSGSCSQQTSRNIRSHSCNKWNVCNPCTCVINCSPCVSCPQCPPCSQCPQCPECPECPPCPTNDCLVCCKTGNSVFMDTIENLNGFAEIFLTINGDPPYFLIEASIHTPYQTTIIDEVLTPVGGGLFQFTGTLLVNMRLTYTDSTFLLNFSEIFVFPVPISFTFSAPVLPDSIRISAFIEGGTILVDFLEKNEFAFNYTLNIRLLALGAELINLPTVCEQCSDSAVSSTDFLEMLNACVSTANGLSINGIIPFTLLQTPPYSLISVQINNGNASIINVQQIEPSKISYRIGVPVTIAIRDSTGETFFLQQMLYFSYILTGAQIIPGALLLIEAMPTITNAVLENANLDQNHVLVTITALTISTMNLQGASINTRIIASAICPAFTPAACGIS